MNEQRVTFPGGKFSLEGVISTPDGAGTFPAVMVCHPHPLYGGSMENNVVISLCHALARASFIAFRFNFRGVGRSEGEFSGGSGEQADAEAAIAFLATANQVDAKRLGVAGYSAGAVFALPAGATDARIKSMAAISPPFSMSDFGFLRDCPKPKLIIAGSEDDFAPAGRLIALYESCRNPKEYAVIEGSDHFWRGYEPDLNEKVCDFFARTL